MSEKKDLQSFMATAMALQESVKTMQNSIAKQSFSATNKGKCIRLTANGKNNLTNVELSPEFMQLSTEEASAAILEVFNALRIKIDTEARQQLHQVSQEMDWPVDPDDLQDMT